MIYTHLKALSSRTDAGASDAVEIEGLRGRSEGGAPK
jgi:hypothetical protein